MPERKYANAAERQRAYRERNLEKERERVRAAMGTYRLTMPEEKRREQNDKRNARERAKTTARPFVAIDGEGLGERGYHLLAASTGEQIENRSAEGLSSFDCLRFLLQLGKAEGRPILVGFGLGYDCEHWIRDLSLEQLQAIRDDSECEIKLDGKRFILSYVVRKWFKLGYDVPDGKGGTRRAWSVEVYDLFSFFQQSFLKAVAPPHEDKDGWNCATPEEWATLQWGKGLRGGFTLETWAQMVAYNAVECACLVRLANKLRDALKLAEISLNSWHGPGAVANALLRKHKMGDRIGFAGWPEEVKDATNRAYFGGRFEVLQLGIHSTCYDYDISSAYPKATTLLPSTTGTWERVESFQGDAAPWVLYHVEWDLLTDGNPKAPLVPFPWRDEYGSIHYAPTGRGWYWAWEVIEARRHWGDRIRILEGWRLYPEEEGVFEWMLDLARKRVEAKQAAKLAEGEERDKLNALQRVFKLALNSVYGKTIQTVGKKEFTPPFLNPAWAGMITSWTRATLLREAAKAPEACICFATDGLFSTAPIDVPEGDGLGAWELAETGELHIYKSGCYSFWKGDRLLSARVRGVPRDAVDWATMRRVWEESGPWGEVTLTARRFIGHKTALARNDRDLHCRWVDVEKVEELHPGTGISHAVAGPFGVVAPVGTFRWETYFPLEIADSHPYKKLEAITQAMRDDEEEREFAELTD